MRAAFYTIGCKVNQYETDGMREAFRQAGFEIAPFDEPADAYIINSCSVTATSEKKTRQTISRAHTQNPAALIAVCGCYALRAGGELLKLPGVRLVWGTKNRGGLAGQVLDALNGSPAESGAPVQRDGFEELPGTSEDKTRALIKIQDGCDNFCAYCIIPHLRGRSCSRDLRSIALEAADLERAGFREIVITGINLSAYGNDNGSSLADAIRMIADNCSARLRLGSLDPCAITPEFVKFVHDHSRICRHFHLSLQSGSDGVLSRMGRKYSAEEYLEKRRMLSSLPGCAVTTDIIAGFPGETGQEHEETMRFVERAAFARIHVFPFSAREGTRAASLPGQLPKGIKHARAAELIGLGKRLEYEFVDSQVGSRCEVLVEQSSGGVSLGYTGNYIRARVAGEYACGSLLPVLLEHSEGGMVNASVVTRI